MRYISRLYIVVDADGDGEAADVMSVCLSETLKYKGHIVDWAYSSTANVFDHPTPLIEGAPDDLEDADMDSLFAASAGHAVSNPIAALNIAEEFMRGFEGDEMQEGIDEKLATIRAAIENAGKPAPAVEYTPKAGFRPDLATTLQFITTKLDGLRFTGTDQNPFGIRDLLGSCAIEAERASKAI